MTQHGDSSRPQGQRPPIYKDLFLIQLALLVFLVDQFTKFLVRALLPLRASFPEEGFFRITHTFNTGSAFGLFQGQNTPLILVSFVGIAILMLIYRTQLRPTNLLRFSLGLQIGGATGNLLDRLRLGYVTDFIEVGPWPIFNVADASIVTGLVLLAWLFLRSETRREKEAAPEAGAGVVSPRQEADRGYLDSHSWCPICDGVMEAVPGGWRCACCGVRERIEPFAKTTGPPERDGLTPAESRPHCPMCDQDMHLAYDGWQCASCGARERPQHLR